MTGGQGQPDAIPDPSKMSEEQILLFIKRYHEMKPRREASSLGSISSVCFPPDILDADQDASADLGQSWSKLTCSACGVEHLWGQTTWFTFMAVLHNCI